MQTVIYHHVVLIIVSLLAQLSATCLYLAPQMPHRIFARYNYYTDTLSKHPHIYPNVKTPLYSTHHS